MDEYNVGSIEANGVVVPIRVDDMGRWLADYDGRVLGYETRDKLEGAIKRLTKSAAVKVAISVIRVDRRYNGASFVPVTLTGIHGANGNVLGIEHHGGRRGDLREQYSSLYGSGAMFFSGDVTEAQCQEYSDLLVAKAAAERAVKEAEKRYEIRDLKGTVQRAIDAHTSPDGK